MNRDLKLNFLQKGSTLSYVLIKLTLPCRKVNRNIKFDCEKSSLAFSIRLGEVVDQQSG